MKNKICIFIISSMFLVSCNSVRDSAGVNRKQIDEYSVIENPPLVIPPNFNLLPPDQIESKNIQETDSDLAKEILFGLEDDQSEIESNNSIMSEIVKETEAEEVATSIREDINSEFNGEKSSINDEIDFESEEELNAAIKATENKEKDKLNSDKKVKTKKKFFFFKTKEEKNSEKAIEPKKKKRFFFF